MDENPKLSRRSMLRAVALLAGATLTPSIFSTGNAVAQQKVSKESVKYQDKPNGDKQCSNCLNFLPNNNCKVVEGTVSPQGYCIAWAKKA
jgi:hypothetical protein